VYRFAYAAVALALASPASAQFRFQSAPSAWVGLGVGAFNANDVADGKTGTVWDFGDATTAQYRLSLEKALRGQSAFGLTGTYVRAPIIYHGNPATPATCVPTCDAHVDLYGLYASFHAGGGLGFHHVLDAGVGVMSYQNFRRDSDREKLAPSAERDFSFTVSYGFGYAMSPRTDVNIVQEYGFTIHESEGTPSGASNTLRFATTRLALRLGFGGRR
jgi:hypothetical protein